MYHFSGRGGVGSKEVECGSLAFGAKPEARRAWGGGGGSDEASIDICFKEAVFIGQGQNWD